MTRLESVDGNRAWQLCVQMQSSNAAGAALESSCGFGNRGSEVFREEAFNFLRQIAPARKQAMIVEESFHQNRFVRPDARQRLESRETGIREAVGQIAQRPVA